MELIGAISRWKRRFEQRRIPGLTETRHPGQKPTVITPKLQAGVLEATRRKPTAQPIVLPEAGPRVRD